MDDYELGLNLKDLLRRYTIYVMEKSYNMGYEDSQNKEQKRVFKN